VASRSKAQRRECDFCGKTQREVAHMTVSATAAICNEYVELIHTTLEALTAEAIGK
jgi:ATP-dependent protease Clp ATPase subunit